MGARWHAQSRIILEVNKGTDDIAVGKPQGLVQNLEMIKAQLLLVLHPGKNRGTSG